MINRQHEAGTPILASSRSPLRLGRDVRFLLSARGVRLGSTGRGQPPFRFRPTSADSGPVGPGLAAPSPASHYANLRSQLPDNRGPTTGAATYVQPCSNESV